MTCFRAMTCAVVLLLAPALSLQATHAAQHDDVGNSIDQSGTIRFADVVQDYVYRSGAASDDLNEGAIGPMNSLAACIAESSMGAGFASSLTQKVKEQRDDFDAALNAAAAHSAGYVVAVLIGIFLVLVFPFFSCYIFIKMIEAGPDNLLSRMGEKFTCCVLAACVIFLCVSAILMKTTNDQVSTNLIQSSRVVSNMEDVNGYIETTLKQVSALVRSKCEFTANVLTGYFDDIQVHLGEKVKNNLEKESGLQQVYADIEGFHTVATDIVFSLDKMMRARGDAVAKFQTFQAGLGRLQAQVDEVFEPMGPERIDVRELVYDVKKIPDETQKFKFLDSLLKSGFNEMTTYSRNRLDDILVRIYDDTKIRRNAAVSDIQRYTKLVAEIESRVVKLRDNFLANVFPEELKALVKSYFYSGVRIDLYRNVMSSILTLLMLAALVFLFSNCAEIFNKTDVVQDETTFKMYLWVSLSISWALLALTTVTFAISAPLEMFACVTLGESQQVDAMLDAVIDPQHRATWLGEMLYPGKNVSLTFAEIMSACEQGRPVYYALGFEKGGVVNIDELADYKKYCDTNKAIDEFKVDFSEVKVKSHTMDTFLDFMLNLEEEVDFDFYGSLATKRALSTLVPGGEAAILVENKGIAAQVHRLIQEFDEQEGAEANLALRNVTEAADLLKQTLREQPSYTLKMRVQTVINSLLDAQEVIEASSTFMFKREADVYKKRFTDTLDAFVTRFKQEFENEIGKCKPITNLYNNVVLHGMCRTLRAVCGWWFTMGCTVFFLVPTTVGIIKAREAFMVKHSRRFSSLLYVDEEKDCIHPGSFMSASIMDEYACLTPSIAGENDNIIEVPDNDSKKEIPHDDSKKEDSNNVSTNEEVSNEALVVEGKGNETTEENTPEITKNSQPAASSTSV